MRLPARLYHLAEASNWASIQRTGLLPAGDLLARAGLGRADRERLGRAQRSTHTALPSGASIRDQRPMPAAALEGCLVGLTPAEWYALINGRVFFWLDPKRLDRQRAACGVRPQVAMTFDAAALADAYGDHASVTPINSGNARRRPACRGAATFVPYATWLATGWASEAAALGTRERSRSHRPVEFTVARAISDAMRFVTDARELRAGERFED